MEDVSTKDLQDKPKAYLVVDTSTLNLFEHPAHDEPLSLSIADRDQQAVNTFTAMLDFLGQNGVQVIIPQIVAFQVGRLLDERTPARDLFPTSGSRERRKFAHQDKLTNWLQQAWQGNIGGVNVVTSNHPPEVTDYLVQRSDIASKYQLLRRESRGAKRGENRAQVTAHNAFLELEQDNPNPSGYNMSAAYSIMDALPAGVPVFFLSEQDRAQQSGAKSGEDNSIGQLNLKGFISAFPENGLAAFDLDTNDPLQVVDTMLKGARRTNQPHKSEEVMDSTAQEGNQGVSFKNILSAIDFPSLESGREGRPEGRPGDLSRIEKFKQRRQAAEERRAKQNDGGRKL